MSQPQLKLVYFNLKGLAETSRILLALANVDYEDFRFPFHVIDAEKFQFKRDEFEHAKKAGYLDRSMRKLPYLEVHDREGRTHVIPQSRAIERFIARHWNMMGSNELEAARIDSVCECVRDIREEYMKVRRNPKEKEDFYRKNILEEFVKLDRVLDSRSVYSVGDKLSLADVNIFMLVTHLFDNKEVLEKVLDRVPRLRAVSNLVAERPVVQQWLSERPETIF